jgi:hypothetical protein
MTKFSGNKEQIPTFSVSLRLWSDKEQLVSLSESVPLVRKHIHFKGLPIKLNGPLKNKLATMHYVCFAGISTSEWSSIESWISNTIELISGETWLSSMLLSKEIEAELWVSVFAMEVQHFIDPTLLSSLTKLKLNVHFDKLVVSD